VRVGEALPELDKWARRQDENFTGEAFAYVLGECCRTEPAVAASLLSCLTSDKVTIPEDVLPNALVRTQSTTDTGRPTSKSARRGALIFVEVKVWEVIAATPVLP
jgi:hypothetical protein